MYGKWTDCIVSQCLCYCQSLSPTWTNTLAYCAIRTLQNRNVLLVWAPSLCDKLISLHIFTKTTVKDPYYIAKDIAYYIFTVKSFEV
jgi:hypothetical protein